MSRSTRIARALDGVRIETVNYDAERVHRDFARVARVLPGGVCLYDLLMGYWERGADRELVAGLPPLPAGAKVLELGVGTGYLTRLLERRYPSAHIIGLDLSDKMLSVARRRIERSPQAAGRSHLNHAPTLRYPHATRLERHDVAKDDLEPADCVVSSFLLDLLDARDLLAVLSHIHRALRPGGSGHLVTLTTEHARHWQRIGALKSAWYDRTIAGYLACYRSRVLRGLSHRLLDYYAHCRPLPLRRVVVASRLFRIGSHRLTSIRIAGVPLLPAQILEIVPR